MYHPLDTILGSLNTYLLWVENLTNNTITFVMCDTYNVDRRFTLKFEKLKIETRWADFEMSKAVGLATGDYLMPMFTIYHATFKSEYTLSNDEIIDYRNKLNKKYINGKIS
jgi:hypothetical protein